MDNARAAPHQSTPGYLLHSLAFDLAALANHPGSTTIKPNGKQYCFAQHYYFEQRCFTTRGRRQGRGRAGFFMLSTKIRVQKMKNDLATTSSIAHTLKSPVLPFRATLAPPTACHAHGQRGIFLAGYPDGSSQTHQEASPPRADPSQQAVVGLHPY